MVPFLPSVTIFSATERAALALARVVVTRRCSIRLQTRLASIALRCSEVRPSLAVRFKCLMAVPYSAFGSSLTGVSIRPGSKFMPSARPSAVNLSLISFSDFLPKLRYLSISCSLFKANWPTVVMLALFKQFAARTETAADFHGQLHLKFFLFVEGADVLVGIDQFNVLVQLNVAGGHDAFLAGRQQKHLLVARVRLELDLLQVQNDVGHVLDDAVNGGELVHRAVHFQRGDGRAFERRKQHAAERVADGVAVTGFKRVGDEFRVGGGGGGLFLLQPLGHFKTS